MTHIKKYAEAIDEEISDAKEYAEKYVENRVREDIPTANKYKEMANDELKHAGYLHEWAVKEIEKLSRVYTPPADMQDKWNKLHKEYVEKTAWIKQMLSM